MAVVHYIWDDVNDSLLEEVDDSGNFIASYTNEPGPFGKVISQERNGVTSYYHYAIITCGTGMDAYDFCSQTDESINNYWARE